MSNQSLELSKSVLGMISSTTPTGPVQAPKPAVQGTACKDLLLLCTLPSILAKPMLTVLLLKGQPGSGKSTLGRALAQRLGWALIDKDDARDCFQTLFTTHPGIDWNSLSYDVMFNYARTQLSCGVSIILDCPLARLELFERAAGMAAETGARVVLVECVTQSVEVWRQRVEARGLQDAGTARAHKPDSWEAIQAVISRNNRSEEWSDQVQLPLKTVVDTSTPLEQQLQQVHELLTRIAACAAF